MHLHYLQSLVYINMIIDMLILISSLQIIITYLTLRGLVAPLLRLLLLLPLHDDDEEEADEGFPVGINRVFFK